jgi:hypothetical protein
VRRKYVITPTTWKFHCEPLPWSDHPTEPRIRSVKGDRSG